mgnify:CR=1 FL=1
MTALLATDASDDAAGEPEADATLPENTAKETTQRSPARYSWAMRLARLYLVFPLICPLCGGQMRIIAFITEGPVMRNILDQIGEPSSPPPIASARGPPEWEMEEGDLDDQQWDVLVDREPEFNFDQTDFDQTVSW